VGKFLPVRSAQQHGGKSTYSQNPFTHIRSAKVHFILLCVKSIICKTLQELDVNHQTKTSNWFDATAYSRWENTKRDFKPRHKCLGYGFPK
jgi:hypothetical protein